MLSRLLKRFRKEDEPEVVPSVDVARYMGTWYEIASFPNRAQRTCTCTKAEYTLTDKGYAEIRNTCERNGKVAGISGKAFVVPNTGNAKLKVQIFWPLKADYWIIDLAEDYAFAVVSTPSRKNLWILSRTPYMDDYLYQKLVARAAAKGLDVNRLVKTSHRCTGSKDKEGSLAEDARLIGM